MASASTGRLGPRPYFRLTEPETCPVSASGYDILHLDVGTSLCRAIPRISQVWPSLRRLTRGAGSVRRPVPGNQSAVGPIASPVSNLLLRLFVWRMRGLSRISILPLLREGYFPLALSLPVARHA